MAEPSTAPDGAEQATNAVVKRVLRKIDRRLIPLLFTTYMFNFMDKVILSSAAVFGLRDDTVRSIAQQHRTKLTFVLGTSGPAVQLGIVGVLLWLPGMGISNNTPDSSPTSCEILDSQHLILGCRGSPHSSMHQFRGLDYRALLAGSR